MLLTKFGVAIVLLAMVASNCCRASQRPFERLRYGIKSLTETCLECMCDDYRGMRCEMDDLCGSNGDGDCDLLGIGPEYWELAGSPTAAGTSPSDEYASLNCKRNPECSGRAVLAYMARYERSCRPPKQRTCLDYAAAHQYGYDPENCADAPIDRVSPQRRGRFEQCMAQKKAQAEKLAADKLTSDATLSPETSNTRKRSSSTAGAGSRRPKADGLA